ncbi:hypothetical protein [Vibrio maritimus]|uniref:hypothetical protein n=1 Tax=Vibrio maritimus TaxID=990268 RepID=UPI001F19027E|nr:hypothetical protein [Vibrio maritimus]
MKKLFVWVLAMTPLLSQASLPTWLKTEKPKQLGLYVEVLNECMFDSSTLNKSIKGEFLRASIKPVESDKLYMNVQVVCLPQRSVNGSVRGNSTYVDIRFGTRHADGSYVLYDRPMYGTLMQGGTGSDSASYFVDEITRRASNALTDYLMANME